MYYALLFQECKNTIEMQKKIFAVYGEGAVTNQMCQKWCEKFLGTVDIWPNNSLLWGCLMHWKVVSSTPGLYPLEANSER